MKSTSALQVFSARAGERTLHVPRRSGRTGALRGFAFNHPPMSRSARGFPISLAIARGRGEPGSGSLGLQSHRPDHTPRLGTALGRHHRAPFPNPAAPPTPRGRARGVCVSPRALQSLRCSSSAREPLLSTTAGAGAFPVAFPSRHVPGGVLPADPRARRPKGPAGRCRSGLHAPGRKQDGPVPGVRGQLPGDLLAGRLA